MTRVLVVDDDASVRASLAAFFEDEGFEVSSVGRVDDAVRAVAPAPFDLLVVDLRLPDGDGESLIIRVADMHRGTRFLLYTGSTLYQISPALVARGMTQDDVFYKPVPNLGVLVDAARRALARQGAGHGSG